jgi:NTP pyrophosphatase (non-canonical NTP hydrolase)
MTIQEAQKRVDEWIRTHGVRYFNELTNMAMLTEQSYKKSDRTTVLADELADVLFVIICLANQTGVDLTKALEKNLEKKSERDAMRHRENPKL